MRYSRVLAALLITLMTATVALGGSPPEVDLLRKQLRRDEGLRLKPYRDNGHWTIGVGRNLTSRGISKAEALLMFENDMRDTWTDLYNELPWVKKLDPARRGVLANMAFNLGIYGLIGMERFLEAVQAEDYRGAARLMLETKWAVQTGERAKRLSVQMETGTWQ